MKIFLKTLFTTILTVYGICFFHTSTFAATGAWNVWGNFGVITTDAANFGWIDQQEDFSISATGVLYVAYKDYENGSKLTVKVQSGSTWNTVGSPGFSSDTIDNVRIRIAPDGTPYVAYGDTGAGGFKALRVARFNGSSWVDVASADFGGAVIYYASLSFEFAPSGALYIAFTNRNYPASQKLQVMQYNGTNWVSVGGLYNENGQAGGSYITSEGVCLPTLAFSADGTPYVAFSDQYIGATTKASVMKFNGTNWVSVGPQYIASNNNGQISLALDSNDTPYLAYTDGANSNHVSVIAFNGTNWVTTGSGYTSSPSAGHARLVYGASGLYLSLLDGTGTRLYAFDGTNWNLASTITNIYAFGDGGLAIEPNTGRVFFGGIAIVNNVVYPRIYAYYDRGAFPANALGTPSISAGTGSIGKYNFDFNASGNAYAAYIDYSASRNTTVMAWSGSVWSPLGGTGAIPTATGATSYTTVLAVSPITQKPYIAYLDTTESRLRVSAWNGSTWAAVGNPLVAGYAANQQLMAFAPDGTPYVTYREIGGSSKVYVQKFDGTSWSLVWGGAVSSGDARNPATAVAPDGTLYLAYSDATNNFAITVRKFNGTSWVTVGTPGFGTRSGNTSFHTASIAIDASGIPYIIYNDYSSATVFPYMYVARFDGTNWVNVGGSIGRMNTQGFLATSPNRDVYIVYRELADAGGITNNPYLTTIKKWNGTTWVMVWSADFTSSSGIPSLAIDPIHNVPYALLIDANLKVMVASPLLVLGSTTSVVAGLIAGSVSLTTPASIAFPSATVANTTQTLNVAGGSISVEDLKWSQAGYYATLATSDLSSGAATISKSNISAYVSNATVNRTAGSSNSAVNVPTGSGSIGTGYVPLTSAVTIVQRNTSGGLLGKYDIPLSLRIALPAYTPSGNYSWVITLTLIEN